ncbi:tetratricopeptide repeat protein [Desulfovibrio mangrovi]|uniref:tetratricopeptide repeat protein n=1 Tax=Desulfovibrio mangrovi TaxID=2976983 RepID=UPI00224707B0|nr:tetratricopeptide repeat protein [Desulfovibrio mangrovi]UZP65835.1 tetratricopeptide repeat protein [Desulfovibrio mangrovi]
MKGPYYLNTKKYNEGVQDFSAILAEDPENAEARYYMARLYLADDKPEQALPYITKAVELEPGNDTYLFWKGIAHWALMEYDEELRSYEKALALNPMNLYARLYMGHNLLDRKDWNGALAAYDKVLGRDSYDPDALYNRPRALHGLKRFEEERKAWLTYLKYYPDGALALRAVDSLNALGDFSWRNFLIGKRRVSFEAVQFEPGTDELKNDAKPSLQLLGAMLGNSKTLKVHIVTYVDAAPELARKRALRIREYILGYAGGVSPAQLPLSWFGVPEKVTAGGKTKDLREAVSFITEVEKQ